MCRLPGSRAGSRRLQPDRLWLRFKAQSLLARLRALQARDRDADDLQLIREYCRVFHAAQAQLLEADRAPRSRMEDVHQTRLISIQPLRRGRPATEPFCTSRHPAVHTRLSWFIHR